MAAKIVSQHGTKSLPKIAVNIAKWRRPLETSLRSKPGATLALRRSGYSLTWPNPRLTFPTEIIAV
jgi:hypothetical protein